MVFEFQNTAFGMQARVDEFVEQYAESTKNVIDEECSDVKKHKRDLVENAEALAWHEENVVTKLRRELLQARCRFLVAQWLNSKKDNQSLLLCGYSGKVLPRTLKGECENVFCSTGIKIPMVSYLNESCMSPSGNVIWTSLSDVC